MYVFPYILLQSGFYCKLTWMLVAVIGWRWRRWLRGWRWRWWGWGRWWRIHRRWSNTSASSIQTSTTATESRQIQYVSSSGCYNRSSPSTEIAHWKFPNPSELRGIFHDWSGKFQTQLNIQAKSLCFQNIDQNGKFSVQFGGISLDLQWKNWVEMQRFLMVEFSPSKPWL